ncbi:FKBP-type peptidyl-prolyl cis-trans isomerase [Balneola sp. MJW-20]|uniref:FKBP-type peptidyl-prolyl cis-trans isomerase n=1 Tax=Gracilimonas aurantiaca TaxID=3234185 RepID=UPI003465B36C
MKLFFNSLLAASIFITVTACNNGGASNDTSLNSKIDSVSYAVGYQQGNFLRNEGLGDLSESDYRTGFSTGLSESDPVMTEEQMFALINTFRQELAEESRKENIAEGEDFLESNKENDGVMVTDSGLQYKVITEGDGDSPAETDVVKVNYEGKLIDGRVFDSSYDRGEPVTFRLNGVIRGWTEGLQLMREGGTYEFYIPYNLAYGNQAPQGSIIEPFETLIFKVELIEVNP